MHLKKATTTKGPNESRINKIVSQAAMKESIISNHSHAWDFIQESAYRISFKTLAVNFAQKQLNLEVGQARKRGKTLCTMATRTAVIVGSLRSTMLKQHLSKKLPLRSSHW